MSTTILNLTSSPFIQLYEPRSIRFIKQPKLERHSVVAVTTDTESAVMSSQVLIQSSRAMGLLWFAYIDYHRLGVILTWNSAAYHYCM